VTDDQRQELMRAALAQLTERGYRGVSVDEARRQAGISEEDFDAEFRDKDGCLVAAYEHLAEQVLDTAVAGCDSAVAWPERIRAGLTVLLERLAADPEMARAMTRAFPGIRPSSYKHYVDLLSSFVPYMREGRRYSEVSDELPGEVELLAVGAAEAIIFNEVDSGRTDTLPQMVPEILFSVLVPFMGPDRAADEMRTAAAAI
jgi:AcrR family transcriptional regulator